MTIKFAPLRVGHYLIVRVEEDVMKAVRAALLIGGILVALIGLVWVGQGSGYFPYPSTSFMVNELPWVYRGAALAVVGLIAVVVSRRI
ncbi:MAG: hypothetical protein ACLPKB_24935 [Xanthobacteraceae bacterium]